MKKLNELQENSERQSMSPGIKINEQKEYFTQEIETLRKNKTEILGYGGHNEMKDNLASLNNGADIMEDRISDWG